MNFERQFDPAQWRTLQFAPFLILSGVSGRYRGFADEEMLVFERWLAEASRAPGVLSREILAPVSADVTEFAEAYAQYDDTIVSGLTAVAEILVGQPPLEVQLFRDALIDVLGMGLGRARGPYGRELTNEGEQMLTMLDEFLRPGVVFGPASGDAA
jgi:hypothetical protein